MPRNRASGNVVKGHGLAGEGWPYGYVEGQDGDIPGNHPSGPGMAKCACGEKSGMLPTTAARKRWHRDHKDQVRGRD